MTIAAPTRGHCAQHPAVFAEWACQRCGSFVCGECERRTRPEAPPLCPKCWDLRNQAVDTQLKTESRRLQVGGLVLGALSLLHPLLMVASLILNIRELVRGTGGDKRWMNVAGLALTGVGMLVWIIGFAFIISRH